MLNCKNKNQKTSLLNKIAYLDYLISLIIFTVDIALLIGSIACLIKGEHKLMVECFKYLLISFSVGVIIQINWTTIAQKIAENEGR